MDFAERLLSKILQDELDEKPRIVSEAARLFETQQTRRTELHLTNLINGLNTGQLKPYQVVQIAMAAVERFPLERRVQVRKTQLNPRSQTFIFSKPEDLQNPSPEEQDLVEFYDEYPLEDHLIIVDVGLDNGTVERLYLVTRLKSPRHLRQYLRVYSRGTDEQKSKAEKALRATFWSDDARAATRFLRSRLAQDLASRNDPESQAKYRALRQMEMSPRANAIAKMKFALQQSHLQALPALKGHSFEEIGNRFERMAGILLRKTGHDLFEIEDEILQKFEEARQQVKIPLVTLNDVALVFVGALASWQASDFPDEDVKFKRISNKWARKRKWRDAQIPTR